MINYLNSLLGFSILPGPRNQIETDLNIQIWFGSRKKIPIAYFETCESLFESKPKPDRISKISKIFFLY